MPGSSLPATTRYGRPACGGRTCSEARHVGARGWLPGKVLGNFRYEGTRPDDPNDLVPHEQRRELRALRVFGAWTNLRDLKSRNTLDTLVNENGQAVVKHWLQDVGSTFGMCNDLYNGTSAGSTSIRGTPP